MNNKFVINDTICFNTNDFTITYMNDSTCLRSLVGVKGRCLQVLLESKDNEVITKKQLHYSIWEKFGFYSNDNCLLQTIYTLRKELKQLDLEDIILTSPRVGYKINPKYKVYTVGEGFSSENFSKEIKEEVTPQQHTVLPEGNKIKITKVLSRVPPKILSLSAIVLFIVLVVFLILYFNSQGDDIYIIGRQDETSQLESRSRHQGVDILKYLQTCRKSNVLSGGDADFFICNSNFGYTPTLSK